MRKFLYLSLAILLALSVFLPPIIHQEWVGVVYRGYALIDHQYPSRSLCAFFQDGQFVGIGDCIQGLVYGETHFTEPRYSGIFTYNKEDVGKNRMDVFFYEDRVGYKFPLCARDTAIILGLLIAPLAYRVWRYRDWPLLLLTLPLAVDGLLQLLTGYEASNVVRVLTGLLAGTGLGMIIYGNWVEA